MKDYAQYIGIPFVSNGRSKTGADCWGLVRLILQEQFDIELPILAEYDNALNSAQIIKVIKNNKPLIPNVKLEDPEEGCIVLMGDYEWASHVGIYVGSNMVLHTTKRTGAVVEKLTAKRIKNKIKGYYSVS